MRMSYWISDVCSSGLRCDGVPPAGSVLRPSISPFTGAGQRRRARRGRVRDARNAEIQQRFARGEPWRRMTGGGVGTRRVTSCERGRQSADRERVCQNELDPEGGDCQKKTKKEQ